MRVITIVDRAVLAAYCQAYGRWVEAEQKLKETPLLIKTPSGYVQQSPWLNVANRQMELMGRYMAEIGLTPASRSRIKAYAEASAADDKVDRIEMVAVKEPDVPTGVVIRKTDGTSVQKKVGEALRAAVSANAAAFAADLASVLADVQAAGHTSLRAIAAELTARGIKTRKGGRWGVGNVSRILRVGTH